MDVLAFRNLDSLDEYMSCSFIFLGRFNQKIFVFHVLCCFDHLLMLVASHDFYSKHTDITLKPLLCILNIF